MRIRTKSRISNGGIAAIYAMLGIGLMLAMYPFFYMLSNSVKTGMEIMAYPNALPRQISLEGYVSVFRQFDMPRLFANSVSIAVSVSFLNCLLNAMVAYAVEKMQFRGRKALFRVILSTMMIPGILLLVPTYIFMYRIHWVNTYRVLILPAAVSAYNIFLIKQFLRHIDNEYLEAARCDGANHLVIFFRLIVPMSVPVLTTVAILSFMGSWNDLFGPLLYLRDPAKYTLQLGLYLIRGSLPGYHLEELWAALGISTLPMVFVYIAFQRHFLSSYAGVSLR